MHVDALRVVVVVMVVVIVVAMASMLVLGTVEFCDCDGCYDNRGNFVLIV